MLRAGGEPILSPPLREALAARLERREQSLLLLNRRGYATSLLCRECGLEAMCPNCSVSLTLHRTGRLARCHYCGYEAHGARSVPRLPRRLPAAHGLRHREGRRGAWRRRCPGRASSGSTATAPAAAVSLAQTLAAFEQGEIDILVGTQMIAKGHDFPRVTLVGVVDADVGLGIPDFRAAERTFQLLTQVAGRAGRGDAAGEVILQTHMPDHYAIVYACAQDYPSFFERELEFRRTMGYPPAAALVNLIVRSTDEDKGRVAASALGALLRDRARGGYRVLGPARAPLARLRQEHRFQILLKGRRKAMREAVKAALVARYGETRWPGVSVDVDPLTVL